MIITLRWMQDWMDTISAPHGGAGLTGAGRFLKTSFLDSIVTPS